MPAPSDTPPRSDELRRQRAAVAAHLAWLDREIAAAERTDPADPPIQPMVAPAVDADHAFEQLQAGERTDTAALRRGCLLAFIAAFLLLVGAVAGAYWFFYAGR